MNIVVLMGRLTKDPDVRTTTGQKPTIMARFNLAVDRGGKKDEADFISCITFGKQAEFIQNYVRKGTKLVVRGRIQTGSYTAQDGRKVYTTDVIVEKAEFAESKSASGQMMQSQGTVAYQQPMQNQAVYGQPQYQQPIPQGQVQAQQAPAQPYVQPQQMAQPMYQQSQQSMPAQQAGYIQAQAPTGQVPVGGQVQVDPNAPSFV